ncbi:sulfocyanin-like copper-binding protein [Azospirillum sp. sgz302134]
MTRLVAALAFAGTLTAVFSGVVADEKLTPSWITANPDRKQVRMDVVAGWNPNNGALNFNGYYKGGMTVVVPVGWTVSIKFTNHDGMLPHSLLVTKAYAPNEMPDVAGVNQVAIPRAYTNSPEQGLPPNGGDTLDFKTSTAGDFDFICGVAAHATGGMWTKFRVDDQATEPYMIIASGVEEGRK